MGKGKKFLFGAIVMGIIAEFLMVFAIRIWENNMPIVHIYTILEFIMLLSVFHHGKQTLINRKIYFILLFGFVFAGILNIIFFQGIWVWNSFIRTLEGIILISIALYYFFLVLRELEIQRPERKFLFWFSIAILIYFTGNLLIFVYSNYLTASSLQSEEAFEIRKQIWVISFILNIILYSIYSVSFLFKEQKPIPESSLSVP